MDVVAKINDIVERNITITLSNNCDIKKIKTDIEKDKEYLIKIEDIKSKRTLQQNKYIWEIISQIDKKINGYMSDEMSIYISLIKQAKIKTVYIETVEEAKKELLKVFRYVEDVEDRVSSKGIKTVLYRCYYGTSKFDKKEMADFIECLINYSYEVGIDIYGYEQMLRGRR
ncbi:hypothetical protein HMPREF1143_1724 [Peptoanaerobacter stomatis]|uniref:Uncharacterized protein n=1 Tax=Peptoanaerobacter stomatis TaxID=796937 RepID=J5UHK9_9FIRM|nr:hypothetical protein [Peptoanaerobacter stomatis]EJU22599.1 hypothetical protein HMPREF1143_1724 [Peptoanaerobacter stomatis]